MSIHFTKTIKTSAHHLFIIAAMLGLVAFASAASDQAGPGMSAADALQRLLDGNQKYVNNRAEHPDQRPSDSAQHPMAVILSCSDSRVPPEIAFDQGVGNLFVVRAAGN